jgi:hypothetical protein
VLGRHAGEGLSPLQGVVNGLGRHGKHDGSLAITAEEDGSEKHERNDERRGIRGNRGRTGTVPKDALDCILDGPSWLDIRHVEGQSPAGASPKPVPATLTVVGRRRTRWDDDNRISVNPFAILAALLLVLVLVGFAALFAVT